MDNNEKWLLAKIEEYQNLAYNATTDTYRKECLKRARRFKTMHKHLPKGNGDKHSIEGYKKRHPEYEYLYKRLGV